MAFRFGSGLVVTLLIATSISAVFKDEDEA